MRREQLSHLSQTFGHRAALPARLLALLLALLVGPGPALAAPRDRAERRAAALVKDAERLYSDGRYREAAELMKKAYELDPHPRLIYNAARAYDQAGDLSTALEHYRNYVTKLDADPTLIRKANLAMDRLRSLIAKEEASRVAQEKERQRLETERKNAEARAIEERARAERQDQEYKAREQATENAKVTTHTRRLVISAITGGLAVAGLGAGVLFGLNAKASRDSFTSADTVELKQRYETQTRQNALLADIGFGVALAAGVATFFVFPRGPAPEATKKEVGVVLTPSVGPGQAGAELLVRF